MINKSYTPSTNGLQSYVEASPEYELAPLGIASMQDQAQKLAEFGRNGDIYVVHAAEGETVIPIEVLEANPQIKTLLFNQMAEMGLDPQRYVVGDQLNSLNPVTGMPEFFFKSIFRGIKKAVKSVVKIVKKIAPIALPIAASVFGVPFLGAALPGVFGAGQWGAMALANGIGTLIGGGDLKDAFKSAAVGGVGALIGAGVKGLVSAPTGTGLSGFSAGIKSGFTGQTPIYSAAGELIGTQAPATSSQAWQAIAGGDPIGGLTSAIKGDLGSFSPIEGYQGTLSSIPADATRFLPTPSTVPSVGSTTFEPLSTYEHYNTPLGTKPMDVGSATFEPLTIGEVEAGVNRLDFVRANDLARTDSLFAVDQAVPSATDPVFSALSGQQVTNPAEYKELLGLGKLVDKSGTVISNAGGLLGGGSGPLGLPGTGSTLADTALYGGGAYLGAKALGAFDVAEEEDPQETLGAAPLGLANQISQPIDPDLAEESEIDITTPGVSDGVFTPRAPVLVPTFGGGGMAEFPRRDLLVEGPGTERSDDIPAMLSDGEFVFNSRAVHGADPSGGGNRYAGAQNLYNLMRNFEMRA